MVHANTSNKRSTHPQATKVSEACTHVNLILRCCVDSPRSL